MNWFSRTMGAAVVGGVVAMASATPASAAFMSGSISASGSLASQAGLSTIVSQMVALQFTSANLGAGTGTFLGGTGPTITNFSTTSTNFNFLSFSVGSSVFTWNGATITGISRPAPINNDNLITDSLTFQINGSVSVNDNSYDTTNMIGVFTATGSCVSAAGVCSTVPGPSASWNLSLTANESLPPPPSVPEPASMAVLGIGMVALGAYRRRRQG